MKAKMKDADAEFCIIEDVGLDENGNGRGLVDPFRIFFCRRVAENTRKSEVVKKLGLKNGRAYLGPTSMDTEISLIMANLAQVTHDPTPAQPPPSQPCTLTPEPSGPNWLISSADKARLTLL